MIMKIFGKKVMRNNQFAMILMAGLVVSCPYCKKTDGSAGPAISNITPDSGPAGNIVTITGNGFNVDPAQNVVSFNGQAAQVLHASVTQLVVVAPTGATTGPVTVSVNGRIAKGPGYTFSAISVQSLTPASGISGDTVTMSGMGLSNTGPQGLLAGQPVVRFNGKPAIVISSTPTELKLIVPVKAGYGPVSVSLGGDSVIGPVFNYIGLDTLRPLTGNVGTVVTLIGGFGLTAVRDTVTFNGVQAIIDSGSPGKLTVNVPSGANTGNVFVTWNGNVLKGPVFTFVPPPTIASLSSTGGPAGFALTIVGTNFSSVLTENTVSFNGVPANVQSATATQLVVTAPAGATSGPVSVTVNGQKVTGPLFSFQSLGISSINPPQFFPPATITISGVGFSPTAGQNTVKFNGIVAVVVSASDTQLVVNVPSGVNSGSVSVGVGTLTASKSFVIIGVVTLAGGPNNIGLINGQSPFVSPAGLAIDATGNVYVADAGANNIRKITPDGVVSNFAGDPGGSSGDADGPAASALFNHPTDLAFDQQGNLYVADQNNDAIRKINPAGTVTTFVAIGGGNAIPGVAVDQSGNVYALSGTSNTVNEYNSSATLLNTISASAGSLEGIVIDAAGNVYLSDQAYGNILESSPPSYSTIYINNSFPGQDPLGIALDNSGNLIISLGNESSLYLLSRSSGFSQKTILTGGTGGYQDGPLGMALFNQPMGLAVDTNGNIYVADQGNQAIRKITLK